MYKCKFAVYFSKVLPLYLKAVSFNLSLQGFLRYKNRKYGRIKPAFSAACERGIEKYLSYGFDV
jgi:hypothetical protein